jgi:hypothetical protein
MRRSLVAVALLLGMVAPATSAGARESIERYLSDGATADFEGSGVLMCDWGSHTAAAAYSVVRSEGMTMVEGAAGHTMAAGPVLAVESGAGWRALRVDGSASWAVSPRYSVGSTEATIRLGRPAQVVSIMEGDRMRARLVVDVETAVALQTDVYDGSGGVFRTFALTEFRPGPVEYEGQPGTYTQERMIPSVTRLSALPEAPAGYRLVDTYGGPAGSLHAYFSDGLFSFSVFESRRMRLPAAFEAGSDLVVAGDRYRMIVTPSHLWVAWSDAGRTYILVGDLPPDHLEAVLAEMPQPGEPNLLVKLWRRLFG